MSTMTIVEMLMKMAKKTMKMMMTIQVFFLLRRDSLGHRGLSSRNNNNKARLRRRQLLLLFGQGKMERVNCLEGMTSVVEYKG